MVSAITQASVQSLPDSQKNILAGGFWHTEARGDILPAWGTRVREKKLLEWDRHERNWMWQSARAGLTKKVAAAPNELSGGRTLTKHFRRVFDDAHFGAGWQVFIKRVIRDYLRHDVGAFIEVIAPGDPRQAPTGRVVGIAHLDSMRCFPTGDPEYPVVYHNRSGKLHLLHRARVIHLVDMPDGDDVNPGYGECALSRAITIASRSLNMTRYVDEQLDDKPTPGILVARGMSDSQFEKMKANYKRVKGTDAGGIWGRTLVALQPSASNPIGFEHTHFGNPPPEWSFKEYVELDVNALALALGMDVQELWQLTGGNLGSGKQSEILHAKSQGRTFGDILTMLERAFNFHILPEALKFEFKRADPYEALSRVQAANQWGDFVAKTTTQLSVDEQRNLLANQVEAVRDAVTDTDGQVVRLVDTDPESTEDADNITQEDVPQADAEPEASANDTDGQQEKAIQATRLDFEDAFEDLLGAARSGSVNRRQFSIRLRNLLRVNGRKAYEDGLEEGGVTGEFSDDDQQRYTLLLAEQSQYVTQLGQRLFSDDGVTDTQAAVKPVLWFNKSIQPFFDAGRLSAQANGMFEFVLGSTEDHCVTCLALSGQRHRLKLFHKHGLFPKSSKLACGGWFCDCRLVRTSLPAQGRLAGLKRHTHERGLAA